MKKITKILSLLVLFLMITSCKKEKSLQSYLVESQDKKGFSHIDFPVGSMITPKTDVSYEVKETIKSIKKVNVTFLRKTDDNDVAYETEKNTLKNVFSNKNYKSLGSVKANGMNMKMYYIGNTESIDEVIAFGYSKKVGVGIARLLGKNMNPAKVTNNS